MPDAYTIVRTPFNEESLDAQSMPDEPHQPPWSKQNVVRIGLVLLVLGFFLGPFLSGSGAPDASTQTRSQASMIILGLMALWLMCGMGVGTGLCALNGWYGVHMRLAALYMLIVTFSFNIYASTFAYDEVSLLFGSKKNLPAFFSKPMPWDWWAVILGAFLICIASAFPPRTRGSWFGVLLGIVFLTMCSLVSGQFIYRSVSTYEVAEHLLRPALQNIDAALHDYAERHPEQGYPPQDQVQDYTALHALLPQEWQARLKENEHDMGFEFQAYNSFDTNGDGRHDDYTLTVVLRCPSFATCHDILPSQYTLSPQGISREK